MSPADEKGGPGHGARERAEAGLTLDEAKERAQWLADRVRGRRPGASEPRRLPDETIEDFVTSDLLRMNQARRWGGHELGQAAVVELVSKVAEGDGSSGWVFGLWPATSGWSRSSAKRCRTKCGERTPPP